MNRWRKTLLALTLLVALGVSALAAGAKVTLRQEDPVLEQAAAFEAYLDQLPEGDREAWHQQLGLLMARAEGAVPLALFGEPEPAAGAVYIVGTGKVYHLSENCRTLSRSKSVRAVSLEEALALGRRPCKVCGGR